MAGGGLYAIDVSNGGKYEQVGLAEWHDATAMTACNGSIFIVKGRGEGCSGDGGLYCFDPHGGSSTRVGSEDWGSAIQMVALDGALFLLSGGALHRVDPKSGAHERIGSSGAWGSARLLLAHGDALFVVSGADIHRVCPQTGALLKTLCSGGWGNAAVVSSNHEFLVQTQARLGRLISRIGAGENHEEDLERLAGDVDGLYFTITSACGDGEAEQDLVRQLVQMRPALRFDPGLCDAYFAAAIKNDLEQAALDVCRHGAFCCDNVQAEILSKIAVLAKGMANGGTIGPRREMMLCVLSAALCRTHKATALRSLEIEVKTAIVVAARRRIEDPALQAAQRATILSSAWPPESAKQFKPLGSRATKHMLEVRTPTVSSSPSDAHARSKRYFVARSEQVLLFMPLMHLQREDVLTSSAGVEDAKTLLETVVLRNLQDAFNVQIARAQEYLPILKEVYVSRRAGHRRMYLAKLAQIRNKDFHKFNAVAKEVAEICAEALQASGVEKVKQSAASFIGFYRDAVDVERKYIDFVRAMQVKTGGETFVPAKIKGVHRALEKMALRESANRWLPDNCPLIRRTFPYEINGEIDFLSAIKTAAEQNKTQKLIWSTRHTHTKSYQSAAVRVCVCVDVWQCVCVCVCVCVDVCVAVCV